MKTRLKSYYVSTLISQRRQRAGRAWHRLLSRVNKKATRLVFFHRVTDAWSWLLSQALREVAESYDVEIDIRLVSALPIDCVTDPDRLDRYAAYDAMRLARAWNLGFPDRAKPPTSDLCRLAERIILARPRLQTVITATSAAWQGNGTQLATLANEHGAVDERSADSQLAANHRELVRRGHYLGGMVWFQGEWYWGLDRLALLEGHLRECGFAKSDTSVSARRFHPIRRDAAGSPLSQDLEFYFSFRSPYSYLAAHPVAALADRLGLNLVLRPLLPMVARGIPVPVQKLRYIIADVARLARQQGQAFGPVYDPLGAGVERCLAVFHAAALQGRGREFMFSAMQAIWCEATNLSHDRNLYSVALRAGLDATTVSAALGSMNWRATVEANAAALAVLGLWGVPGFSVRGPDDRAVSVAWGQDRLWAIERSVLGIDVAMPAPVLMK